ncbi:hypothetical protein BDZ94DRAFT_1151313 [Collybia nuda]|uniref:F-box domain-containing protein n=1 Tax=Collybia nuda TaxID=64659 RepID=A0A9P5YIQ2_9AGAR|nr:hypothetical protein BDZ94DRAFT_1151313 [Collybia nuda]
MLVLPPEIWLSILRWATISDMGHSYFTASYSPFQPTTNDAQDSVLAVKTTLTLVCREWKYLMTEFLYEDLKLLRGASALKNILYQNNDYGKWVRRVVLPYSSTVTSPGKPPPSIDILRVCQNLEILVRPRLVTSDFLQFQFDAEEIPITSLRRLDWWHHGEADRTGGINSLGCVLQSSPKLEYLSIGGVIGNNRIRMDGPICLHSLQTLRLQGSNGLLLHFILTQWSLPILAHIVLDSPPFSDGLEKLWGKFSPQLRTIEFGKHVRFLMNDFLASCLRDCPNLTEINYYLFFTSFPALDNTHTSLVTIGLHASVNPMLQDGESVCAHIEQHFERLTKIGFPSLKKIVLYGEWRGIIAHPRLASMWKRLYEQGFVVERSDISRFGPR